MKYTEKAKPKEEVCLYRFLPHHPSLLLLACIDASKQIFKLFSAQMRLAYNGTQCAPIEFFMIWHNQLCKRIIAAQNNMTAVLALVVKACFVECTDTLTPRYTWEFAHTATTRVSRWSSGTGNPSSSSVAM